jgi:hypothetical protein
MVTKIIQKINEPLVIQEVYWSIRHNADFFTWRCFMVEILARKTWISLGIGAAFVCAILTLIPRGEVKYEKIAAKAEESLKDRDFEALSKLVEKYPCQLLDYRKNLTGHLLETGQIEHSYFKNMLKRLGHISHAHAQMTHVSLLISKGDLDGALEESMAIEAEFNRSALLGTHIQPGSIARIVNLQRIAELYSSLGRLQEEADAWEKFEQFAGWDNQKSSSIGLRRDEAFALIEKGFRDEGIDLKEYIRYRVQNSRI